jgi:hypothetical protein
VAQADQRARRKHVDAELFVELALEGRFGALARLDFSAREFPLAGIDLVGGPLADQDLAALVAQRAGGDVDEPTCGTQR